MTALADLPSDVARHCVLSEIDTAEFFGVTVRKLRHMEKEGYAPKSIETGWRSRGWRIGDLIDYVNCIDNASTEECSDTKLRREMLETLRTPEAKLAGIFIPPL